MDMAPPTRSTCGVCGRRLAANKRADASFFRDDSPIFEQVVLEDLPQKTLHDWADSTRFRWASVGEPGHRPERGLAYLALNHRPVMAILRWGHALGAPVALAVEARDQQDSAHEISPIHSFAPDPALSLRRVSVPTRDHYPGRPLVPAVRALLPGRRGAPGRARDRGRPRHDLPLGPTLRAGVRRGRTSSTAPGRGSLARR